MSRFGRWGAVVLALGLAACGGLLKDLIDTTDCSTTVGQNTFVRDTMKDIYFWYRDIPDLDPRDYDSPEAYLEAIRYRPLDTHFSFISDKDADTAYYSESQFIGVGLSYTETGPTEARITQAFPDSPASEVGLDRGHFLLEVNGRSVPDLINGEGISAAFGPSEIGVTVDLVWQDLNREEHRATLVKRLVTIPTVSLTRIYDIGGRRIGYVFFRNFVRPSIDALNRSFSQLRSDGATDLVLDLRYNGGGMTEVAQHLASLVGGRRTKGEVFAEFFHNDKNAYRNSTDKFKDLAEALDLPSLIVVTTSDSASASEAVINGLRPFMPVTVIGSRSYGKPVGQYGFDFCDKVLYPVSFKVRNARGEGDYFDGFAPECPASDDLDRLLGDPAEASLAEALVFAGTGRCSPQATAPATRAFAHRRDALRQRIRRPDGWHQLVNAY